MSLLLYKLMKWFFGGEIMANNNRVEDYIETDEEREAGHADTRGRNFECENKTRMGCDMGIDVAG